MRGYQDVLDVTADAEATPVGFVWRGRRYRVVQVLEHWREPLPWWRLAVMPEDAPPDGVGGGERDPVNEGVVGDEASIAERLPLRYQSDQCVWRVEAAAGRLSTTGVFELAQRGDFWCLRRLSD